MPLSQDLRRRASKKKAKDLQWFFKTGPGQYGEGDKFLGLTMPVIRRTIKPYQDDLSMGQVKKLLASPWHEERMAGLLVWVHQFKKQPERRGEIHRAYRGSFRRVNNWDLVDLSAPTLVGQYLMDRDRKVLNTWVRSKHLWTRRIGILATYAFIREGDLDDALRLSAKLFGDEEDLMHKAVGWMLREAWKKDPRRVEAYLKKHIRKIPRTSLRYAIERVPEAKRKRFLKL